MSVRLPAELAGRLRAQAGRAGETVSGYVVRLVDEGLRSAAHPGIVFRSGPAGRRAALARGPDVREVVSLLRTLDARGDAAVHEAAEWLHLPVTQIQVALDYFGAFPTEIEDEIAADEQAAEDVRRALETRGRLLA